MAVAGGIPVFLPTHQRNLLIHGNITPHSTAPIPDTIQIVTFMHIGQLLEAELADDLTFWLNNASGYLKRTDIKLQDGHRFTMSDKTIVLRVYNPGEICPNFRLSYIDPFREALGFYNTHSAYLNYTQHSQYIQSYGKDVGMTTTYTNDLGLLANPTTDLETTIRWLSANIVAGKRYRIFLLACSQIDPAAPPPVRNMNLEAPEGGWPNFINMIHTGGRRKSKRAISKKSKKTRRLLKK